MFRHYDAFCFRGLASFPDYWRGVNTKHGRRRKQRWRPGVPDSGGIIPGRVSRHEYFKYVVIFDGPRRRNEQFIGGTASGKFRLVKSRSLQVEIGNSASVPRGQFSLGPHYAITGNLRIACNLRGENGPFRYFLTPRRGRSSRGGHNSAIRSRSFCNLKNV